MTLETNKQLASQITYAHNAGNLSLVHDLLADDFVSHFAGLPFPLNKTAYIGMMEQSTHAFAEFTFTIDDIFAEGDKVVIRLTGRGVHVGEFMGIPATNKPIEVTGILIRRIQAGKIAEEWHNNDMFGMMQQLGVLPNNRS